MNTFQNTKKVVERRYLTDGELCKKWVGVLSKATAFSTLIYSCVGKDWYYYDHGDKSKGIWEFCVNIKSGSATLDKTCYAIQDPDDLLIFLRAAMVISVFAEFMVLCSALQDVCCNGECEDCND